MNTRLIEVFHAIMQTGSVTGAASSLNVSQPAVTASLKQLEQSVGFSLFHRSGGRLKPTMEARALFSEAERVHDAVRVFGRLARRLQKELSGHLRVVTPPAFSHELVPEIIGRFMSEAPDCMVDMTTQHHEQILGDLSSGAARNSLGFTFGADDRAGVGFIPVGEAELVAVLPVDDPHEAPAIAVDGLITRPMIGTFSGEPLGNRVAETLEQAGYVADYRVRVHNHSMAANLVIKGVGVAIVDHITAAHALGCYGKDKLMIKKVIGAPTLPVTAVYDNRHPLNDHAKQFIKLFRQCFRAL